MGIDKKKPGDTIPVADIMQIYIEERRKWVEVLGSDAGFDDWFYEHYNTGPLFTHFPAKPPSKN
jgi:hypothetical protein